MGMPTQCALEVEYHPRASIDQIIQIIASRKIKSMEFITERLRLREFRRGMLMLFGR